MSSDYAKGKLYLNVPYEEKDEAKALGAKFDGNIKKWYYEGNIYNYPKFSKWILKDTDEVFIAYEYLYILEAKRNCWKCHKDTTVVALGIGEFINLYETEDGTDIDFEEDRAGYEPIHIAWADNEKDIPPKLLKYLKRNYSVKTGYSKTLEDNCFANHCECCGTLQGNWFLFNETDSPFSPSPFDKDEFIHKMAQITIKMIPIDANIQLNWNITFSDTDYAYLKYGKSEELILSDDEKDNYITYQELFEL